MNIVHIVRDNFTPNALNGVYKVIKPHPIKNYPR